MRKKNGWSMATMIVLMCILIFFGIVAIYYIYRAYEVFNMGF